MVGHGTITGTDVTAKDVNNYKSLLDPDGAREMATIHNTTKKHSHTSTVASIGQIINADIIFDEYNAPYLYSEDRHSKMKTIAYIKNKSSKEILQYFQNIIDLYIGHGHSVRKILTDNEEVFRSCSYPMMRKGIIMQFTPSGQHNKIIERSVRTLKEKVNTLKASLNFKLPEILQKHCYAHALYLLNRYSNNHTFPQSSWEVFSGEKLNIKNNLLLPFGTIAIFYQDESLWSKGHPLRGEYGIFIGKEANMPKSFKVYMPSRDEVVDRGDNYKILSQPLDEWNYEANTYKMPKQKKKIIRIIEKETDNMQEPDTTQISDQNQTEDGIEVLLNEETEPNEIENAIEDVYDPNFYTDNIQESETRSINSTIETENKAKNDNNSISEGVLPQPNRNTTRYSLRERPARKTHLTLQNLSDRDRDENMNEVNDSYMFRMYVKEALSKQNPNHERAREAIKKELEQMIQLNVYELINYEDIPTNSRKNIISSIIFLKDKYNSDGTYEKTKARLAARGDQMKDTLGRLFSSPTANLISLCTILSISAKFSCHIRKIDVPGAYSHADLPTDDFKFS